MRAKTIDPEVAKLMAEIELLDQQVLVLKLKIESMQASDGWARIKIMSDNIRGTEPKLSHFARASLMPIVAGVVRLIYKAAYRKKK